MVTALGRTISAPLARPVTSAKTEMLLLFPAPEWLLLRAFRLFCAALRTAKTLDTKNKRERSEVVAFRNYVLLVHKIALGARADDLAGDRAVRKHNSQQAELLHITPHVLHGTIVAPKETKSNSKGVAKPSIAYKLHRLAPELAAFDAATLIMEYVIRSNRKISMFPAFVPLYLASGVDVVSGAYATALSRAGHGDWGAVCDLTISELIGIQGIGNRSAPQLHERITAHAGLVPRNMPIHVAAKRLTKTATGLQASTIGNISAKLFNGQAHPKWTRHALASALSARIPTEALGEARSHLRMTNTTWHQNYVQRSQNFPCYRTFTSAPSIADVTTRGIHPRFAPAKCVLRTILWGAICKARATTEGNTESVQIVDLVHQYVPDLVPTGAIFYWRHLIWSSLNALLTEQVLSKWPWSPRC